MTTEEALRYMLSVKEQFRGNYKFSNTDDMERLINDGYTQTERSLIYALFD